MKYHPDNAAFARSRENPRWFIDRNGPWESEREGVDKLAHDAWVKTTTWNLSRDDFIRLSYFNGCMENDSEGRYPFNGSGNRPDDVVYADMYKEGHYSVLTRSMVSEWLNDYLAYTRGYRKAYEDMQKATTN